MKKKTQEFSRREMLATMAISCAFGQPVRFGIARVSWLTEVAQISCLLMESSLVFAVIRRPNLYMIQRLGLALILIISSIAPTFVAEHSKT